VSQFGPCGQSGQFASPVRAAWLNVPEMVEAAKQTRESGATKFCIVAAVRLPDENLMAQMRLGLTAVKAAVDIQSTPRWAWSPGSRSRTCWTWA
jgi:biotin synthase